MHKKCIPVYVYLVRSYWALSHAVPGADLGRCMFCARQSADEAGLSLSQGQSMASASLVVEWWTELTGASKPSFGLSCLQDPAASPACHSAISAERLHQHFSSLHQFSPSSFGVRGPTDRTFGHSQLGCLVTQECCGYSSSSRDVIFKNAETCMARLTAVNRFNLETFIRKNTSKLFLL